MKRVVGKIVVLLLASALLAQVLSISPVVVAQYIPPPEGVTFGGESEDIVFDFLQTSDGGFAFTGWTGSFYPNPAQTWLFKTDSAGVEQWSRTYGTPDVSECATCMVELDDGSFVLGGEINPDPGAQKFDFWLAKVDPDGTMLWEKTYGDPLFDEWIKSLVETDDGGFALLGERRYGYGSGDFWLVKTDSEGNMLWEKTYGGSGDFSDGVAGLIATDDGGFGLAGYIQYSSYKTDFWLIKTDQFGNTLWDETYGGEETWEYCYDVVETSDGGFALLGQMNFGSPTYNEDVWLVKTDSGGNKQWDKAYSSYSGSGEYGSCLVETIDGGFAIGGRTLVDEDSDFWLIKTDSEGNMQWDKTYGGSGAESASGLMQTSNGRLAFVCYTDSFGSGLSDAWFVIVPQSRQFLVTQGTNSWIVEPIHGTVDAPTFYDYVIKTQDVTTQAYLYIVPNPVGVGQSLQIMAWISPLPPYPDEWHGLTLKITKPSGEIDYFLWDASGAYLTSCTADQVGTWDFQLIYPGETYGDRGLVYLPSQSPHYSITVQNDPVSIPSPPPWPYIDPGPGSIGSGHTLYMEETKSKVYLYEDPEGELSLIMHHGEVLDGSSPEMGIIHLLISGLPEGAFWSVEDDQYEPGGSESSDALEGWWYKEAGCSDGGVISGLTGEWTTISIYAGPMGTVEPGVTAWEYQADSTTAYTLDMDTDTAGPVTIRPMAAGEGALTVQNVLAEGSPVPDYDWSYLLTYPDETEHVFTLSASGGSRSFTGLEPGTYTIAQTRKDRYLDATVTVDSVEVPATSEGSTTSVVINLLPGYTTSVEFSNEWIPPSALSKDRGSGDSSANSGSTYTMPSRKAVPVQACWDPDIEPIGPLDLVKDKATKIMVNLADLLTSSNPLGRPLAAGESVTVSVTCAPAGFFTNPTGYSAQRTKEQITAANTLVFDMNNPPSTIGSYTITCTTKLLDGTTIGTPVDTAVKVRETRPLSLYYSHVYRHDANGADIDYGTEPASSFNTMLTNSLDLVKGVYPVPLVNVISNTAGFQGTTYTGGDQAMYQDCKNVWLEGKARFNNDPFAIGVAIAPDLTSSGYPSYFKYNGAYQGKKVAVGISYGPAVRGVVVSDGYYSAVAHEIGHVFNLYYGVPEQYTVYNPGAPANGFWVEKNSWVSGYDFMGLSTLGTNVGTWVNTDFTFEPLFSASNPSDPQIILVNGMINEDGTVVLPPEGWYYTVGTPDTVPTGNFALKFTLANGNPVVTSFAAQFFMNVDPGIEPGEDLPGDFTGFGTVPINFAPFAFAAPYPEGTTKIELVDTRNGGEKVIATIDPQTQVHSVLSAGFGGFISPVKEGASFKAGTTVPVKFQLKTPGGAFITNAQPRLRLSFGGTGSEIDATSAGGSNTGNLFRYDFANNQYVFNLDTRKLTKGTWQLRVYLGDGTVKTVNIIIK